MRYSGFSITAVAAYGLVAAAIPAAAQQSQAADAIIGKWQADDGSVKMELYRAGTEYQARLLYGNQLVEKDGTTFKLDVKNADRSLRARSLKNIVFIRSLHWDGKGWSGGSLYDGSSGRTYSCKMTLKGGKMYLRGYIGLPALGQTRAFHRAVS